MKQLKSGLTLGILGGGQLGRMSAMAAARLGISVIIFCPEENSPASHVAKETIVAPYSDEKALKQFSEKTDVISYEFENIPIKTIEYIESLKEKSVLPGKILLRISQDRIKEKHFLNTNNIQTTRWKSVSNIEDIKDALKLWQSNGFILKTTRFGYDGKGQFKCDDGQHIDKNEELKNFLSSTKNQDLILEELVNFTCEISVIVAQDNKGKTVSYGPMLNEHKNHILHKTTVPSDQTKTIEDKANNIAKAIANHVNLTGVLTVEFFVCPDNRILVNEIAPRTHNSGHWSIDACAVSQFENHVRTVCGLPVGSSQRHSDSTMLNLIGSDVDQIGEYISEPNTCLHLYGKKHAKVGRKMGHVNFLKPIRKL